MVGINFIDTVVVRRSANKGTTVIEEPLKPQNWVGEAFQKREEERLKLAGDLMIMSAKGTKKIRLSELEKPKSLLPKGYYISTRRGTGKIRIE